MKVSVASSPIATTARSAASTGCRPRAGWPARPDGQGPPAGLGRRLQVGVGPGQRRLGATALFSPTANRSSAWRATLPGRIWSGSRIPTRRRLRGQRLSGRRPEPPARGTRPVGQPTCRPRADRQGAETARPARRRTSQGRAAPAERQPLAGFHQAVVEERPTLLFQHRVGEHEADQPISLGARDALSAWPSWPR